MQMNNFELLAPAGSYDAFLAAVENGADAVYLGGNLFNARASATNFSEEELEKAICYAHLRDVKVYITLNILINDTEFEQAVDFAKRAYEMGADAFIVQDLGLAFALRQVIPNINLHLSTQSTVYNELGIGTVDNLNFERMTLINETLDIPLVLHGGTGIPERDIKKAIECGISKININTELQIAWHNAVLEFIKSNEEVYDPRKVIGSGQASMKRAILDKINLFFNR